MRTVLSPNSIVPSESPETTVDPTPDTETDVDLDIDESGFLSVQLLVDNVIPYNDDDDNENGVLDLAESGPMLDSMGNQVADDDLSPLSFMIMNLGVDLAGYRLEVTTSSIDGALAKFWDSPWKQNELTFPLNITFGPNPHSDILCQ